VGRYREAIPKPLIGVKRTGYAEQGQQAGETGNPEFSYLNLLKGGFAKLASRS
jgi:hypothetical protein